MFQLIVRAGAALALAASALPALADAEVANSQIVVRDAATGRLRAATADEARALQATRPAASSTALRTVQRSHASGAKGVRLNDSFMSYSVLVRQPDGSVAEQCFASQEEADAAVAAAAKNQTQALPTE